MRERILIVEDEGIIALHYQEMLENAGFTVPDPLPSGEDALAYLAAAPLPDLILMDIGLAGTLNGIETAREIRKNHMVPVIFLTTYSDGTRVREMAQTSPCGHLVKPVTERDLLSAVQGALCQPGREQDARR